MGGMRPIFEYDHIRGALFVRLDVSADYGKPRGTLFAVNGDPMESQRVAPGAEPPLYCAPIPDARLFGLVESSIAAEEAAAASLASATTVGFWRCWGTQEGTEHPPFQSPRGEPCGACGGAYENRPTAGLDATMEARARMDTLR